jgi:ribosomal protein S18 acetylase RimI-like enzyme
MAGEFRIEVLASEHDCEPFSCGVEALDRYLKKQAMQDVRRRASACYVALDAEGKIAGFYTLAAAGIPLADMPAALARRLPRYPSVPVARLGRLAVDQTYRGRGLGGALLWDAVSRSAQSEIAVFALVVDAKDDEAAAFYSHHGFVSYGSQPKQLLLPLTSKTLREGRKASFLTELHFSPSGPGPPGVIAPRVTRPDSHGNAAAIIRSSRRLIIRDHSLAEASRSRDARRANQRRLGRRAHRVVGLPV